jgi:hypothetical protein
MIEEDDALETRESSQNLDTDTFFIRKTINLPELDEQTVTMEELKRLRSDNDLEIQKVGKFKNSIYAEGL